MSGLLTALSTVLAKCLVCRKLRQVQWSDSLLPERGRRGPLWREQGGDTFLAAKCLTCISGPRSAQGFATSSQADREEGVPGMLAAKGLVLSVVGQAGSGAFRGASVGQLWQGGTQGQPRMEGGHMPTCHQQGDATRRMALQSA